MNANQVSAREVKLLLELAVVCHCRPLPCCTTTAAGGNQSLVRLDSIKITGAILLVGAREIIE